MLDRAVQSRSVKGEARPIGQLPDAAGRAGGVVMAHAVIAGLIHRYLYGE